LLARRFGGGELAVMAGNRKGGRRVEHGTGTFKLIQANSFQVLLCRKQAAVNPGPQVPPDEPLADLSSP
jgi:hypothetical protein